MATSFDNESQVPIPPPGYNLVQSKSPAAPKTRPLADLTKEASSRAPIIPPKGYYVMDPTALKTLQAVRKRNQKTPATGGSISGYAPSTLEQLRDTVANTAIGYSLEQSMPKLADALNLHPSETVNSPTYEQHKEQLLAPEYATQAIAENSPVPLTQAGEERLEGALTGAGGLTTAPSLLMMAAGPLAKPASAAGATLSRLVSGGFTLDMLKGLYDQHKQYREAVDSGNLAEAHKIQGEMGVTGIMALLAGHHALTSHPFTPVTESVSRERTNVLHRNGAGEVRQAQGQAPTVWLSPDAWKSLMGTLYPGEVAAATHGINLPANEHLQAFASDQQLGAANPQFGQVQELLAKAHENAGQGSVAIGKNRPSIQANVNVMREELNHTWQRGLTGKITNHLPTEAFSRMYQAIPSGMYEHLLENGYDGYNSPEMVTEAAAKLMDGRPERFGVDKDDAVDFLDKYFSEVSKQHGPKALESLQHVRGIAKDARDAAIKEHSGYTGGGQDNRTVSGVGNRGPGGVGEGVPATEGQVAPAFSREVDPDSQMAIFREMGEKLKEARNNYSVMNPETVAAYKEALRNYEMSSPSMMRKFMREQMGQMKNSGDVADVQELERIAGLGETLFNREKEKPVWYLKSERLIGDKMKGPMPAEDTHKMLLAGGVKPEEMQWTGLDNFLKSKGKDKVTPEEIREHLANNNIQIKEVTKGGTKPVEYLPITPEMRKSVTEEGVPLFNRLYKSPAADPSEIEDTEQQLKYSKDILEKNPFPPTPADLSTPEKRAAWDEDKEEWNDKYGSYEQHIKFLEDKLDALKNQSIGELRQLPDKTKVVYLTRKGLDDLHESFGSTYNPKFDLNGASLDKPDIADIFKTLDIYKSPHRREIKKLITQGVNDKGGVTIAMVPEKGQTLSEALATLREELGHTWQKRFEVAAKQHLPEAEFKKLNDAIPAAMSDYLKRNDYKADDGTDKANKFRVLESAAKMIADNPKALGLSEDEWADYLFQYFESVDKVHGKDALDQLKHITTPARHVKEDYYNAKGKESGNEEDRGGMGGVQGGGQGSPKGTGPEKESDGGAASPDNGRDGGLQEEKGIDGTTRKGLRNGLDTQGDNGTGQEGHGGDTKDIRGGGEVSEGDSERKTDGDIQQIVPIAAETNAEGGEDSRGSNGIIGTAEEGEGGATGLKGSPSEKPNDKTVKMLTSGKAGAYTLDHWLKNQPGVTITSVGKEDIDPSTLHRLQSWTRENKFTDWKKDNTSSKDFPPVEVVRTPSGDYLYDGTHRTEYATRQGEKIPAKVYTIRTRDEVPAAAVVPQDAARTTVLPIQGNTSVVGSPVQQTVVPRVTVNVLPLYKVKELAAGLAPKSQPGQVKSVRELMVEASKRNPTRMIP
jgi:hypothetical protein